MASYTSQFNTLRNYIIGYLQNTSSWSDGIPKLTDFNEGSVIYTICSAVAVAADALGMSIYMCRLAAYLSTAIGEDLDNKCADYGITRKAASSAEGSFIFTKNAASSSDITIPSASKISTLPTGSSDIVSYTVDEDTVLPAGSTSISVACTCTETGSAGNLAANTALLLSSAIAGIDGVEIDTAITNGSDEETDDSLRERGLAAFQSLAHGTAAYYESVVLAISGISSASVKAQNRGPGTLDIFITGADNSIPSDSIVEEAQTEIDAVKVLTDDVKVLTPTLLTVNISITIYAESGYTLSNLETSVQTAIETYINGLGLGGGSVGYVYASQIVAAAIGVTGVANASTTFTDMEVSSSEIPSAGTITVTGGVTSS